MPKSVKPAGRGASAPNKPAAKKRSAKKASKPKPSYHHEGVGSVGIDRDPVTSSSLSPLRKLTRNQRLTDKLASSQCEAD